MATPTEVPTPRPMACPSSQAASGARGPLVGGTSSRQEASSAGMTSKAPDAPVALAVERATGPGAWPRTHPRRRPAGHTVHGAPTAARSPRWAGHVEQPGRPHSGAVLRHLGAGHGRSDGGAVAVEPPRRLPTGHDVDAGRVRAGAGERRVGGGQREPLVPFQGTQILFADPAVDRSGVHDLAGGPHRAASRVEPHRGNHAAAPGHQGGEDVVDSATQTVGSPQAGDDYPSVHWGLIRSGRRRRTRDARRRRPNAT
ncbi:hypothetical protein CLV71_12728 [Actinophytocola oryzae]|uniref:Uncharacterized protein n=1 Tax=Actinophytocola oryzae TaxID=502181 RepID=A0A4R7USR5_9PSEU|nr:hypothetical protein CLV71_12728 [Actinophytocola oryzae]